MDRNSRKVRQGIVSSSAMDKTITVVVENRKRHPMYNKIMTTSKKLKAHDENNEAGEGDLVEIMETRPLSATKRWRLVLILENKK
jgi:small subunit ribosomal protein S17